MIDEKDLPINITAADLEVLSYLVDKRNNLENNIEEKISIFLNKFNLKKGSFDVDKNKSDEIMNYIENENIINNIKDLFKVANEIEKQSYLLVETKLFELLDKDAIRILLMIINECKESSKILKLFINGIIHLKIDILNCIESKIKIEDKIIIN